MGRFTFIPALICVLCCILCSCGKDNPDTEEDVISVHYEIDPMVSIDDSPDRTRTSLDGDDNFIWVQGDTVGVFPGQGSQIYFTTESGVGAGYADFNGGDWAFKTGRTYSCYYPFIGDIYLDRTNIPVTFTGQKQSGTDGISHIGAHHYLYTDPTSVSSGKLNFSLHHLCCIIRPYLTLPAGTYTKLAITAPSEVFVKSGHYNLTAGGCAITGDEYSNQIQIDLENITLTEEKTFYVYLTSAPVNLKGVEITVSVLDSQKKERQCKKTPSGNYAAGIRGKLTCSSWTEVPQSMGMIIPDWDNSGTISGDAD